MDSVRMVLTHSSSKARWSVCTVKAAPLLGIGRTEAIEGSAMEDRRRDGRARDARPAPVRVRRLTSDYQRYIVMHRRIQRHAQGGLHARRTCDAPPGAMPRSTRGPSGSRRWAAAGPTAEAAAVAVAAAAGRGDAFFWECGPGGPFPPGFPFHRGRGPRARRGDVRAALLALLAEEPRNGYQLMQEIERRSEGVWRPSPGSVYPALQQLEDEGLIRAEVQDGRRQFALTDEGRAHVEAQGDALKEPWRAASDEAGDGIRDLRRLIGQVAAAAMQVGLAGSARPAGRGPQDPRRHAQGALPDPRRGRARRRRGRPAGRRRAGRRRGPRAGLSLCGDRSGRAPAPAGSLPARRRPARPPARPPTPARCVAGTAGMD